LPLGQDSGITLIIFLCFLRVLIDFNRIKNDIIEGKRSDRTIYEFEYANDLKRFGELGNFGLHYLNFEKI
jgi:hypothetical protein